MATVTSAGVWRALHDKHDDRRSEYLGIYEKFLFHGVGAESEQKLHGWVGFYVVYTSIISK